MIEGIDVSKYQGSPVWASVAGAGVQFVVARSSLGQSTQDATFAANYRGVLKAGMIPGAYHVVAGDSSGAAQAANWKVALDAAGFTKGLLVLDVEAWSGTTSSTPAEVLAAVEYLVQWVRDTYNRVPLIYTGVYWRETLKQHPNNYGAPLWLAAYVADATKYVPTAWSAWTVWQYTSTGAVAGITGSVDRDKYNGTLRSLKSLAGWEWDELATQAEIRAIVREEVAAALAADQEASVAAAEVITQVTARMTTTADELKALVLTGNSDVVNAVLDAVDDIDPDAGHDELVELITKLHRHLCLPCVADKE